MTPQSFTAAAPDLNGLIAIQLKAMATLQLQMAAALTGKGQDELRQHFSQSAELMLNAARALTAQASS